MPLIISKPKRPLYQDEMVERVFISERFMKTNCTRCFWFWLQPVRQVDGETVAHGRWQKDEGRQVTAEATSL